MFNREVYLYSNISFKLSSVHDYRLILRRMSNPKFLISNKKRKKKEEKKEASETGRTRFRTNIRRSCDAVRARNGAANGYTRIFLLRNR